MSPPGQNEGGREMTEAFIFVTTWNRVVRALQQLEGNWDGFRELEKDVPVLLTPLGRGNWYEIKVKDSYGFWNSCYFDIQGRSSSLSDWIPADVRKREEIWDREGIAVPKEVVDILREGQ